MNVTVIGGGNGGIALAGYLTMNNCDVTLYSRREDPLFPIKTQGYLQIEGIYDYKAHIKKLTTSMKVAVKGAEVIIVVVPANAHENIAKQVAPHLTDGQSIVLMPGRTLGALCFHNDLKEFGVTADVTVCETDTFLFASRTEAPGLSHIYGIKENLYLAALKAPRTQEVVDKLLPFIPALKPADNIIYTSMSNIGAMFHPVPIIFNIPRIECNQPYYHYLEGITPTIGQFLEQMDAERVAIAAKMGCKVDTAKEWMKKMYNVEGETLYDALQMNDAYQGVWAPDTIHNRYIYEDIPTGLVPMSIMGKHLGVETPCMNSVIELACKLFNTDFVEIGRNEEQIDFKIPEHLLQKA